MIRDDEKIPPMTIDKVAKRVGISQRELQRWMRGRKVVAPNKRVVNGQARRVWSEIDIWNLKQYKQEHYRKGCGRRKAGEQKPTCESRVSLRQRERYISFRFVRLFPDRDQHITTRTVKSSGWPIPYSYSPSVAPSPILSSDSSYEKD
jgi:transcriptional regulator with XRE-family HTH domain